MHVSSFYRLLPVLFGLMLVPLRVHADPAATNLLPPITKVKVGPRDWTPGAPARMMPPGMMMPDMGQDPTPQGQADPGADPGADPNAAPEATPPVAQNWVLFLSGNAQATPTPEGQALRIDIPTTDNTDWHVRLACNPNLVNGQLYELRFRAKSDAARSIPVASEVGSNNVWPGLYRRVNLTTDWQTFARRFVAQKSEDGKNILPEFWLGDRAGSVWLSDVALTPLPAGSSLLPPVTDAAAWEFVELRPDAQREMGMPNPEMGGPTPAAPAPAPLTQVTTDGDAMKFVLNSRPAGYGALWQAHAALNENTTYTLTFRAKADPPRDLPLHGDVEAPGMAPEGLDDTVKVKRDWQTFSVTWTTKPGTKENHIAPQFMVGGNLGTLWLSDVSLTPGAAPAPAADVTPVATPTAAATPKPSVGEIALSGKITAIRAAAHSLTLAAVSVTSPDGKTTALPAPRPKSVLVGASVSLANLKPGVIITVIGKDSGSGKPLTARAVIVAAP